MISKNLTISSVFIWGILVALQSCADDAKTMAPSGEDTTQVAYVGNSPLRITEVTPVNLSLKDHLGEDPAWVEIQNVADTPVSLQSYSLSDDRKQTERFRFGNTILAPGERTLIFLSGQSISTPVARGDSITMLSAQGYTWSDGDRSLSDGPAGNSRVNPYGQAEVFQELNGKITIGASLTLGDNSDLPSDLQWSTSIVYMNAPDAPTDLTQCNTLVVRGYLQNGRELLVRLVQPDIEDWLGWGQVIRGNGDPNGEYRIALPPGTTFPDLKNIEAVKFEAPSGYLTTVSFLFHDVYAIRDPILMHASFRINRKAGTLYLSDSLGIRDTIAYPDMPPGMSYGYDSLNVLGILPTPTPMGRSTQLAWSQQSSKPELTTQAGFYNQAIRIAFEPPAQGKIHFTLDGSAPSQNSAVYTQPIDILKTTVVRSIILEPGKAPSAIQTQTFFIADSATLPVVAISTEPGGLFDADTGIYEYGPNPGTANPYFGANFWAPKELPVSVEFFTVGGALAWKQDAGMSIFGNWSRAAPKKSMSIEFREKYGKPKLEYPLFPEILQVTEFKTFGLRSNGGNNSTDYVRDALAQELVKDLGVDMQHSFPVVVYYNGEYFGIHRLVQKMDKEYPESVFGYPTENIDFVEAYGAPKVGSGQSLTDLKEYLSYANPAETFGKLDSVLDLDEFINYFLGELYANNTDWPANNWRAWRSNNPITKWRFMMFDVDFGFGSPNGGNPVDFDMFPYVTNTMGSEDAWPNGPGSTLLYRAILANPTSRAMFINRLALYLSNHFSPNVVLAKLNKMTQELQSQQARDLALWGHDQESWQENWDVIADFALRRADIVRNQAREYFQLGVDVPATLQVIGKGIIQVERQNISSSSVTATWFANHPVQLRAISAQGKVFTGWSDGVKSSQRTWLPQSGQVLQATFQ